MKTLRNLLYILQLEEYDIKRFKKWALKHPGFAIRKKRKELVWTLKARVVFTLASLINLLTFNQGPDKALIAAYKIISPLEFLIKAAVVGLAKLKIRRLRKLTVIGITGSFGKTSTKIILKQLLEKKYNVLSTPRSYNTPLGIAKVILRQLKSSCEVFIVEMGAYKRGEIKSICNIVKPQIGILTGINEQHLERFGSLENTIAAKFELIDALPESGVAILNWDNKYIRERAKFPIKKIRYSTDPQSEAEVKTSDIRFDSRGTKFVLQILQGPALQTETKLLGRSQVSNILAAVATAVHLGVPISDQQSAISNLPPIPHRLQLIDPGSGILILDDTYSANPDGFYQALEVLDNFENRRKILVTPGIVELGKAEREIHLQLGGKAGEICDFVILVGESSRTTALEKGLARTRFDRKAFRKVKTLEEARRLLAQISRPLDIILFENDLPDQYA